MKPNNNPLLHLDAYSASEAASIHIAIEGCGYDFFTEETTSDGVVLEVGENAPEFDPDELFEAFIVRFKIQSTLNPLEQGFEIADTRRIIGELIMRQDEQAHMSFSGISLNGLGMAERLTELRDKYSDSFV
jgi:hypothetical protein